MVAQRGMCTPTPFHYIYHHIQSCSVPVYTVQYVCCRWDGRYPTRTLSLFLLYPYMYTVSWFMAGEPSFFFNTQYWVTMVWYSAIRYGIFFYKYCLNHLCSYQTYDWLPTEKRVVVNLFSLKLFVGLADPTLENKPDPDPAYPEHWYAGSGSCSFLHRLSRSKNKFPFLKLFCFLLTETLLLLMKWNGSDLNITVRHKKNIWKSLAVKILDLAQK